MQDYWRTGYRDVALALLAGGASLRMGQDKTSVPFGGGTLIEWMVGRVAGAFRDVFVVAREPGRLRHLGVPVVRDAVDARGSAVGIYTALMASPSERVLCLACDMPMVGAGFLRCLAEGSSGYDAFVPCHGSYKEPLCAVYGRAAAGEFERLLADGRLQVDRVFDRVRTGYLPVDEERFGDAADLFMNVNTPEELDRARLMCTQPPCSLPRSEGRLADRVEAFRTQMPVPVVSFVGKKKSGKTSVLMGVIRELVARGYRVAALKHDSHGFEIDVPGTDSFRLREAGALVAGISSPDTYAWVNQTGWEPSLRELVSRITEPVDLLITEGFKKQDAPKIEVSRRGRSTELISEEDELIGIVSDQAFPAYRVPQLSMDDPVGIADLVERQILRGCRAPVSSHGPARGHVIDYLRISVTDRCNLRCVYCMPPEGVVFKAHEDVLSYEDIAFFVEAAVETGISKVRLTGGEPLVRRGLPDLVRMIRRVADVRDISLTTNGILLPRFAAELKAAGLDRVNISLDTLDPVRYRELTRGGSLEAALAGVEAALDHDLVPVKINVVMMPTVLDELPALAELTRARPLHVRFIEWMPVGSCGPRTAEESVSKADVMEALRSIGDLVPVASPGGWGPARYFRLPEYEGTIGFISSVSDHFCNECNRLRLTADGLLKNCLFSNDEVDARAPVQARDREGTMAVIRESLARKTFDKRSVPGCNTRGMSQIGG